MRGVWKKLLVVSLLPLMLAGCCPKRPPKIPPPAPPLKRPVEVRDCVRIDGRDFCRVEVQPLLLNEEDQDNFIERVLLEPVWTR